MSTNPPNNAMHGSQAYVHIVNTMGISRAIKNVQTKLGTITVENEAFPTTLNFSEYQNSYVCSPYTAYISYAQEELGLIQSRTQRSLLRIVIRSADVLLRWAKINQTLCLNNWLVSTNLPPNWSERNIAELTQKLSQEHPQHSLSMRSLNPKTNSRVMQALSQQGWLLIPARQIYLFDNQTRAWWQRKNTKRDQALLNKTHLELVYPSEYTEKDFTAIEGCFKQLFIDKHSAYNPHFSAEYLYAMHRFEFMEFYRIRDPETHQIIASIGLFIQQDIITSPMVGYQTHLPKALGLYRLLMAILLRKTYESGKLMNLSSGAGNFKKIRGGEPCIEYTAFYVNHLPWYRRFIMRGFAKLLNTFGPKVLQDNQI